MQNTITLENLKKHLDFFSKMYDAVRVVDPIGKIVLESGLNIIDPTDIVCYDYWQRGRICDNCISARAHRDNRSYIKLEKSNRSIMLVTAVPIENAEKPIVLELLKNATDTMLFSDGEDDEGRMMARVVEEMNDLVVKDPLTALYNRRFIEERLPVDVVNATVKGESLSVIFMDVDDFSTINDNYGHMAGDRVISEIGNIVSGCIRDEKDWGARFGGDEFVVCLNNTEKDIAYKVAERIRTNIEKIKVDDNKNITVSVGIQTTNNNKKTADELIRLADKNMYIAKKNGKNKIVNN